MRLHFWLSLALVAGSAQASVIDSGSVTSFASGGPVLLAISSSEANFSLFGNIGGGVDTCFHCLPGQMNLLFLTTLTDATRGIGMLTLDGVSYNIIFNDPVSERPGSILWLLTDPYEVTGAGQYVVPFHIEQGFFQVALTSGRDVPLLLNTRVTGGGQAFFRMDEQQQSGTFGVSGPIVFTFGVPEPSSWLMVAGGLLVFVYQRRFSQKEPPTRNDSHSLQVLNSEALQVAA